MIMFSLSSAADSIPNNKTIVTAQPKMIEIKAKANLSESEAYKLLYENSKENNEKILSTVQWTIGLSIGFLVAILGGQIFFNWRINKKEIEYINKDMEEKIGELKAELIKSLADESKTQDAKIISLSDKVEKDLLVKIKDEFEKNNKLNDLHNKLRDFEIESARNDIKNGIKELKIDVEKVEGDIWKIKGVEANALSSYLRTAFLQLELKREVKYILDDIASILSSLEEINDPDFQKLEKLTNDLSPAYSVQKNKIQSLYKDKPVYQFVDRSNNNFGFGALFGPGIKYVKNAPK